MSAPIYEFFEEGFLQPKMGDSIDLNKDNLSYMCIFCKENNVKNKDDGCVIIKAKDNITSNLIKHLEKAGHELVYTNDKNKVETLKILSAKRKRLYFDLSSSKPIHSSPNLLTPNQGQKTLTQPCSIVASLKYKANSLVQKDR